MAVMAALVRHARRFRSIRQRQCLTNGQRIDIGTEGYRLRTGITENRHQTVPTDMLMQDGRIQLAQECRYGIMGVPLMP